MAKEKLNRELPTTEPSQISRTMGGMLIPDFSQTGWHGKMEESWKKN